MKKIMRLEAGDTIWLNNLEEAIFITESYYEMNKDNPLTIFKPEHETFLPPELAAKSLRGDELDAFNEYYKDK